MMKRIYASGVVLLALGALASCSTTTTDDDGGAGDTSTGGTASGGAASGGAATGGGAGAADDWEPLGPDEIVDDMTLADWAVAYAQWGYAGTKCEMPDEDPDGSWCANFQDPESAVFFLAGNVATATVTRTECDVPAGKYLFFPIVFVANDNGGVPLEEQSTTEELKAVVVAAVDAARGLLLTIDGEEVEVPAAARIAETAFSYTLPPVPNWYSCAGYGEVTGTVEPSFVGGYYIMLPPPGPGEHTVRFAGTSGEGVYEFSTDTTYEFTIAE